MPVPNEDQQLQRLVSDDPVRSSTPADQGEAPSPGGSPPLSAQASLPQLMPTRTRLPEPRVPDTRSPDAESPRSAVLQKPPAHRSKSVSGNGANRSETWNEADTKLPGPRVRGGTRSGSSVESASSPRSGRSKSILAILKNGKNRGKSPASGKKYPEGVMGKEGCRQWVKE
ncbi:MAG: hypothetical protein Q9159_003271 [Coniocarpon cinnabarinum]